MIVCLTVILLISWSIAFAMKEAGGEHRVTEEKVTEEIHEEKHRATEHHLPKEHRAVERHLPKEQAAVEHHVPEEIHEEIHAEPHAVVPTPTMYYFYWSILIITLLIMLEYFYKIHRREPLHHETKTLALILIILGITLYFVDQLPSLAGYFDLEKKIFVESYHEPTAIGFLKFVYRIVVGILFMVYAFFGIEHHNTHHRTEEK